MRFLMTAVLLCAAIMMVGCSIGSVLSQNSDGGGETYDFRQSRWGDLKEKVMFSERGIKPQDMGHVLIYKSKLQDVPVKIIYTFDDKKRLRSAGYIVEKPVRLAKPLLEHAIDTLGEDNAKLSSGGLDWMTYRSLIHMQMNARVILKSPMKAGHGPLRHLIQHTDTSILYWTGVWGFMDLMFYKELVEKSDAHRSRGDRPLNYYEKLLFSVMRERATYNVSVDGEVYETPELEP